MQNDDAAPQPTPPSIYPTPVAPAPFVPYAPQLPDKPAPKKKMPKALKVIFGIIGLLILLGGVLVGVLFFVITQATAAPLKVSNSFVDAVQGGDSVAAYALTTENFQKATTPERLSTLVETTKAQIKGDEKVTGQSVSAENGTSSAAVTYSVNAQSKDVYMRVILKKDGDTWKVNNFKLDDQPIEATTE